MPTELEEVLTKSLQLAFQTVDVLAPESTEQGRPKRLRTNVDWLDTPVGSLDDLVCCGENELLRFIIMVQRNN